MREKQKQLLDLILSVQTAYIALKGKDSPHERLRIFETILTNVIAISDSEYGFIGEILKKPDGKPYLKTHAITNIAWNDETRAFYEQNVVNGLEFTNLDTLFGHTIRTGEQVIANDPASHPASAGIPKGHPPLKHYLGVPLFSGQELIGMVGLANKHGGYTQNDVDTLNIVFTTIAAIIDSIRYQRKNDEMLHSQTVHLTAMTDATHWLDSVLRMLPLGIMTVTQRGEIHTVNKAVCMIFGYSELELVGQDISMLIPDMTKSDHAAKQAAFFYGVQSKDRKMMAMGRDVVGLGKDGSRIPLEIGLSLIQSESGEKFAIASIKDIT